MSYAELTTKKNLYLAWQRLNTATNFTYKRFYRPLLRAYGLSVEANLSDLRDRLRNHIYEPYRPIRIYVPKPSGLQRPMTFLCLEDQIVYQALANLFATRVRETQENLMRRAVFSNWLNEPDSIFFIRSYKPGYRGFRRFLRQGFNNGNRWIASFDLSAFYDTIDHQLLLKTLHSRGGGSELMNTAQKWLHCWSSGAKPVQHAHGIPQGPQASNLLAECMMFPVDIKMASEFTYARYVDDIRILGKSELEVRQAVVYLDMLCSDRGLIPSASKHDIRELKTVEDVVSDVASLGAYVQGGPKKKVDRAHAEEIFFKALDESGTQVVDKSKLRYALFRAPTSQRILNAVIRLWTHYPEHTDAYMVFLENYGRSTQAVNLATEQLSARYPYDYVRGEFWRLLARMAEPAEMRSLVDLAMEAAKDHRKGNAARMGAQVFLCSCERSGLGKYSRWIENEENPLVQAFVAPHMLVGCTGGQQAAQRLLRRSLPDPALALTEGLFRSRLTPLDFGVVESDLGTVVQHVYAAIGLIAPRGRRLVDPVGTTLVKRYRVPRWKGWRPLFDSEYKHAHSILLWAERCFDSDRSAWLTWQDSFNDTLFRALQTILNDRGAAGAIATKDTKGKLKDFGLMLNDATFTSAYPDLAKPLQDVHNRRVTVPSAHPYEKQAGTRAIPLAKHEQRDLAARLNRLYSEIIAVGNSLGL